MTISVNIKHLGAKRSKISGVDFHLPSVPGNVRELILGAVHTCVSEYNRRVRNGERAKPLTAEAISDMSEIGRIAFGINYGGKEADEKKAAETAIQAYEDGLLRIFIGKNEVGGLDEKISVNENDSVTFIKLTMLSGRMW